MAIGVRPDYVHAAPAEGPWILYGSGSDATTASKRSLLIAYQPNAWLAIERGQEITSAECLHGLHAVFPEELPVRTSAKCVAFDLLANAFYFLSSCSERRVTPPHASRQLFAASVFSRLSVPQDIVDRYAQLLRDQVTHLYGRLGWTICPTSPWPTSYRFAIALSHDVDFLPSGRWDNVLQGGRTFLRHLVWQRDPGSAFRAGVKFAAAMAAGRDPYGCIPDILAREQALGVRSSFQVAVARRHPADVNYDICDDRIRDYLRAIPEAGFDLCLHGSYRSTERREWYLEEAALLTERLCRPRGSRQHFLSFDYETLFTAEQAAGIAYDMSMGYPDRCGPRAGFSHPYFPYDLQHERPYDVVEISLFYMDVTLRSYMGLDPTAALQVLDYGLANLARKQGAVSVVWHPIVFAGARDPGFDEVYWRMIDRARALGGLVTDAWTINALWRRFAANYASFACAAASHEP